jgi:hypothetical protein
MLPEPPGLPEGRAIHDNIPPVVVLPSLEGEGVLERESENRTRKVSSIVNPAGTQRR